MPGASERTVPRLVHPTAVHLLGVVPEHAVAGRKRDRLGDSLGARAHETGEMEALQVEVPDPGYEEYGGGSQAQSGSDAEGETPLGSPA